MKVLNHQLPKVIINNKKKIKIFLFFSVLTRARRLERELEDAEERAEMVTTTLIRSRSVHRTTDYD